MDTLAQSMEHDAPYQIRRQDDTAHIVESKAEATTSYVIFKENTALGGSDVASVSRPCVITTHCSDSGMVLSIADPDLNLIDKDKDYPAWGYSQPSSIVITLHGAGKRIKTHTAAVAYPKPGETTITVTCKDGLTTSIKLMPVAN